MWRRSLGPRSRCRVRSALLHVKVPSRGDTIARCNPACTLQNLHAWLSSCRFHQHGLAVTLLLQHQKCKRQWTVHDKACPWWCTATSGRCPLVSKKKLLHEFPCTKWHARGWTSAAGVAAATASDNAGEGVTGLKDLGVREMSYKLMFVACSVTVSQLATAAWSALTCSP